MNGCVWCANHGGDKVQGGLRGGVSGRGRRWQGIPVGGGLQGGRPLALGLQAVQIRGSYRLEVALRSRAGGAGEKRVRLAHDPAPEEASGR